MEEKEFLEYIKQFPSIEKLYKETKTAKAFGFLFRKNKYKVEELNNNIKDLVLTIKKYNDTFSDNGWVAYDSISTEFLKKVNEINSTKGYEEAETEILNYYTDKNNNFISNTKGIEEFRIRYHNLSRAFENHYNGNYMESVLIFLTIIDGAINDFTKSKGLFAEGTDVDAWDCIVGAPCGLKKLKEMYNISRKKTNTEEIKLPYRNGILHGRDLNYGNIYCSCKCIVLLMVVCDWIKNKNTELTRKEKYSKENNPPPISESLKQLKENKKERDIIDNWQSKEIIIGKDIPPSGTKEDYKEYPYIQYLIETLDYWKQKNYGKLSKRLVRFFEGGLTEGKLALECRRMFDKKKLIEFSITNVQDKAISLKNIEIKIKYKQDSENIEGILKVGLLYQQNDSNRVGIPELNKGDWVIIPQDIHILRI